jgi:hypothetical protein
MQERGHLVSFIAIVLIAHLWLLQSHKSDIHLEKSIATSTFSTRQVKVRQPAAQPGTLATVERAPARTPRKLTPQPGRAEDLRPVAPAQPAPDTGGQASAPVASTLTVNVTLTPRFEADAAEAPAAAEPISTAANPRLRLQVPGSRRLKYAATGEARKMRYGADAELLWLHDGVSYAARLEVGAFLLGKRVQTSAGSVGEDGLEPKRFSDKTRSEVAAHFERAKGVVVFSANTPDAELQSGAQDRLSVLLQLSALLAGAPERYFAGTQLVIQTIGPREAESWQFVVGNDETLNLKEGALTARKLLRLPQRDFDLKVEVWLAQSIDWLPAQVRLTQANGDFVQLALESVEKP